LENYDEEKFEELPDNFLELADIEDETEECVTLGSYGALDDLEEDTAPPKVKNNINKGKEEKMELEGSGEDDDEFDEDDDGEGEGEVGGQRLDRQRTFQDDMFDVAYQKFEKDLDDLYADADEDDEDNNDLDANKFSRNPNASLYDPVTHSYHVSAFEHVFDEFLDQQTIVSYETPQTARAAAIRAAAAADRAEDDVEEDVEGEDDAPELAQFEEHASLVEKVLELAAEFSSEEEQVEELFLRDKRPQWDCESIVSTYSNMDNHPALIAEPGNRIRLNKKGFPELKPINSKEEEEISDEEPKQNLGIPRQKEETPKEKKQRKKAIKEDRKIRRAQKKELTVAYREETTKQKMHVAGKIENRTILHY